MKRTIFRIIGITSFITLIYSCKETHKTKAKVDTKIIFKKEGTLSLFKEHDSTNIYSLDIEIADNTYETQTGLMYRDSMLKNRGMLFIFDNEQPRSFYMKNTRFPLDIIYINANQKIVSIQENAQPLNESSLPSNYPAKYVLEVNAGLSKTWQLKAGDSISFSKL